MRRPRPAVPLLAALALLGLATPGAARAQSRYAEIQSLLDRRAAAVHARDAAAFLATVDPEATGFRTAQAAWFERVGAVSLAEYGLRLTTDRWGELTRGRDRARHGAETVVALVEERLRIEGFDERPAINDHFHTFVRREAGWAIASDADLEDLGLRSARQLWDFGPVEVRRSEHFLVMAHPADAAFASALLRLAEAALPGVEGVWRRPWGRRVPILVPSTPQELERVLDATLDVETFVAFATASLDRSEGWAVTGSRIIVHPENLARHGPEGRRRILAHELLHVATRGATGPFVASFVEEGLAEMAALGRANPAATVPAGDRRLPRDFEFVAGGPPSIFGAYQRSLSALLFMRERFGIEGVNRFYEAFGSARADPGTAAYHLERAFREGLGISKDEFEAAWRQAP